MKCGTFRNFYVLNVEKVQPWQNTGVGIKFNKKTTAKMMFQMLILVSCVLMSWFIWAFTQENLSLGSLTK